MTRRLVLTYLLLAVVVLVALMVPLAIVSARDAREDLQLRVERDAVALAGLAEGALRRRSPAGAAALRELVGRYGRDTGARAVVVGRAGRLAADSDGAAPLGGLFATSDRPELREALLGAIAAGTRRSETLDTDLVYVAVPVASAGAVRGAVRVTYPTSRADAVARRDRLVLAGVALVVLAATALAGRGLARWVSRPLVRLRDVTVAAGAGDLAVRADAAEGPPEVRQVAAAFNDALARLDRLVGAQREFVADASHQLRSPLTALRLRLENLQHGAAPPAADALARAVRETERLARLVDGLLALARADEGGAPPAPQDVAAVVRERAEAWRDAAAERGVAVAAEAPAALPALLTPGALEQVLDNLVDNALAAAPPGSEVGLNAREIPGAVELRVTDRGPGLAPEDRGRAFDRFWRGRADEGSGLGLAIVRRLVEADGGSVRLDPAPGGGSEAVVTLPRPAPPRSSPGGRN